MIARVTNIFYILLTFGEKGSPAPLQGASIAADSRGSGLSWSRN